MMEAEVMIMTSAGTAPELLSKIRTLVGVTRANIVAGQFDIVATVEADSRQELLSLIAEEIHDLEGVGRTRTCVVLE